MAADVSRVRFDPLRDHSGVGLQQGRLVLDADWNEQVAVVDRRLRAQVADLVPGVASGTGAATVSRLTPDAFKVGLSGGKLTIAPGRIYVDGLLAENHGATPGGFDETLAEPSGTGAVEYGAQPYWPDPDPLPTGGTYLAYLDVWSREVTALQAPDLVEPAIGVDTTTRSQTVWQARLLAAPDGATCATTFTAWDDLIAPSPARLSTGTVPVDPADDPCELPPVGGYRGPENQLYRVEMHTAGTFKWSRDNASVAFPAAEVVAAGTGLRMASLGRDDVLRLHDGDWVEIIDDHYELGRRAGELRKISVDDGTLTVSFSPALPADLIPTGTGDDTVAARHLRVIRWDQRGKVTHADGTLLTDLDAGTGAIPLPAAGKAVLLEHGVTITFGGGTPRPGDHWVFAARASDATLEELAEAPPRGIHHHFARLAVVTLPGTVSDCRLLPAPPSGGGDGCGCEVCVAPGESIQAAVDAVAAAGGGTVVLCPGTYPLPEPIRLDHVASVRLRGHGRATQLVSTGTAIVVSYGVDVAIERLSVTAGGTAPGVLLSHCYGVTLDEVAVSAPVMSTVTIKRVGIGLAGVQALTAVRACTVLAPVGIGPAGDNGLYSLGLRIEDNVLQCDFDGVALTGLGLHLGATRITGNSVAGCGEAGISVTGLVSNGSLLVAGNDVAVTAGHGIVTGGCASILHNTVASGTRIADRHGILVAAEPPGAEPQPVQVIGNRVTGVGGTGIVVEAPVAGLLVKQNVVTGAAGGIAVRGPGPKEHVSIDNNEILAVAASEGDRPELAGIIVTGVVAAGIAGNAVRGVGTDPQRLANRIGIAAISCGEVNIAGNTVAGIGPDAPSVPGLAIGIGVGSAARSVLIDRNTVGGAPARRDAWQPLLVLADAGRGIASAYTAKVRGVGAVTVDGTWIYVQADGAAPVSLTGNDLFGGGAEPVARITATGDALVSGNHCAQPVDADLPAFDLAAPTAVVQGNRLRGGRPSGRLEVNPEAAVVLGNISSGDIDLAGTPVSAINPWAPLNVVVP